MSKKKKTKTLSPSDNGEESSNEQDGARKRKHSSKHHSSNCDRTHRSTKSHDKYSTSKSKEDFQSGRQIKKAVYKLPKDVTHETRRSHHRSGEKVEGKTPSLAIEPREKGSKRRVHDDREEVKRAAKHSDPTCSHTTSDKHSDGSHRLTSKQRNVTQEPTTAKPLQSQVPPKKESCALDSGRQIKKAVHKLSKEVTHETRRSHHRSGEKVEGKTPSLAIEPREKGSKRRVHDDREEVKRAKHSDPTCSHTTSDKHSDGSHRLTSKQRNVTQEPTTAKPLQSQVPPKKESVHDRTSKKRNVTQVPSTAKPLQSQVPPKKEESVHDGTSKQRNVTQEPQPSTAKPLHKVPPKKESVHDGTSKKRNITQVPSTAKPLQSQVPPKKEESVHDGTSKLRNVTQEPQPSTAKPLHKVPHKKESVHDGTSKQRNVTQVPSTAKPLQSQVPPQKESVHDGTQVRQPSVYNLWKPLQSQVPPKTEESVHDGTSKLRNVTQVPSTALQSQVPPQKESVHDGTQVRHPSPYNLWKPLQSQVPPKKENVLQSVHDGTQVRQPSVYNLWKPLQSQVPPKKEESVHDGTSKQRNVTQVPSTAKPLQSQVPPQKEESVHDGTQVQQPSPYNLWNIGPRVKPLQSQVPPKKESVHDGTSKQMIVTQVHSTAKPLQSQVPPKKEESVHDGTQVYDNDIEMEVVEELHEARSKDSLGLRLVKSYGELTSIDLTTDTSVEVVTEGPGLPQCRVIIAMDTNILLSHLDFVKKIMSHGLGAMGFPVILIPWVVLQELDSLKNGKGLRESVARLACPAVHFIYMCLKKQDSGVWGQSMQQASQSCQDLTTNNNDDRVLQCCLQYQILYPERALFLCTNDKNLCSKSLISGVKALNKTDLEEEAKTYGHSPHLTLVARDGAKTYGHSPHPTLVPCDGAKTYGHSPHPTLVPCDGAKTYGHSPLPTLVAHNWTKTYGHSPQPTLEVRDGRRPIMQNKTAAAPTLCERTGGWQQLDKGKPLNKVHENERGEEAEERTTELSNCVSLMEDCLTEVLSAILEAEMKAAYEDLWDEIVYVKPPWSLKAVLQCLNKHWIAVFGSIVPRHQQQTVKNLIVFFSPGKAVDCSTMLVALCEAKSLLEDFLCRSNYGNRVPSTLTSLDCIIRKLRPQTKQQPEAKEKVAVPASHPQENIATWVSHQHENSPTPMQNSHQDVWALFEGIWMNCMELCMKVFEALHFDPNTMQVNWPQGFPAPPQDAVAKLHHLLSVVTQLIQAFHRVLSSNSGCEETQALHTLIYSEGITMAAKVPVKDLLDCFAQQEYREKLRVGGIQLEELHARLERCVEAMGQDGSDTIMVSTTHD